MDWFLIEQDENEDCDYVRDLENDGQELDIFSVMTDLYDAASADDINRLIASKKIQAAWEGLVKQHVFGNKD